MPIVLKYDGAEVAKKIEFARTLPSQILGMMFRRSIPDDFAIIFIINKPSPISVHMLFVFFPLDVIFLDREKKISGLAQLNPWIGYKAMENIKYVIEMKAGTIEKYSISIGGKMEFEDIPSE